MWQSVLSDLHILTYELYPQVQSIVPELQSSPSLFCFLHCCLRCVHSWAQYSWLTTFLLLTLEWRLRKPLGSEYDNGHVTATTRLLSLNCLCASEDSHFWLPQGPSLSWQPGSSAIVTLGMKSFGNLLNWLKMLQNPKCYALEGGNLLNDPATTSIHPSVCLSIYLLNNLYYFYLLVFAVGSIENNYLVRILIKTLCNFAFCISKDCSSWE